MSTPASLPYAFVAKIVAADGQHDGRGGGEPGRHQGKAAGAGEQPVEARLEGAGDRAEQVVEEDYRDGSGGDQPGEADKALAAS